LFPDIILGTTVISTVGKGRMGKEESREERVKGMKKVPCPIKQ